MEGSEDNKDIKDIKDFQIQGTVRQRIIELLKTRAWDAGGLSRALGVSQRQVEFHLQHVVKTVIGKGPKLVIRPPKCLNCGLVFSERTRTSRTKKPSRCPNCKGEHLTAPFYSIDASSDVSTLVGDE